MFSWTLEKFQLFFSQSVRVISLWLHYITLTLVYDIFGINLLARLAPEETAEEGNSRVTDGGTFGVNATETTTQNENGKEVKIGFCGRGGVMRNRVVLAVLFLGCTVQVREKTTTDE